MSDQRLPPANRQPVAYLVNRYPSVSHTFIRREIRALERQGVPVERIGLRGWQEATPDGRDAEEKERTSYVLRSGLLPLLTAAAGMLVRSPRNWLTALGKTWGLSRGADRPLSLHLIYFLEACWVARHLARTGACHLHAHFGTNPATVALLAAHLAGCSWSFTVHGPEEFDKPGPLKLKEKVEAASFVVAISSYGRGQLYRWAEAEQWHKVQVVHCALEAGDFSSVPPVFPTGPARLVCVGRLCEQKGQLLLIEAVRRLLADGENVELVLAGDGEMRTAAEEAIRTASLQQHVRITGWLSGDEVRAQLERSTALVLPSFAEGLPVVIMEAMALAKPVISTYVAGIPELVRPGENGWLVPAGDPDELVVAIREVLCTSPERLAAMGMAGRQRCRERHSVDAEAAKLASLFAQATKPTAAALMAAGAHATLAQRRAEASN